MSKRSPVLSFGYVNSLPLWALVVLWDKALPLAQELMLTGLVWGKFLLQLAD